MGKSTMMRTQNESGVFSSLGADPDLSELVEMFVEEMPDRIATLRQQGEAKDWEELRRTAHQIKGAAGSYGFDQVTPVAATLEASCREVRAEQEICDDLDRLVSLCERLRAGEPT